MMTALFALIAGVLTIAAPCTLPVLPILLGGSIGRTSRSRPVFIVLGIDQGTLRTAAALLLVVFGASMVWPRAWDWLRVRAGRFVGPSHRRPPPDWTGNTGGFLLGTTLGLIWTPCAGPILASILTVIATSPDPRWGAFLLVVYGIGAAVPLLAIAYGGQVVTARARSLARISHRLQQGFGALIVVFAVSMLADYDASLTAWLSGFYPGGRIGL